MDNFVKIAELSGEDRSKLKEFWTELWGKEFASALTFDHLPEGKKIDVEASGIQELTVKAASEE